MTDFVVVAILAVVLGSALRYVIKAKKSGAKCIGCSVGSGGCSCGQMTGEATSSCGCGSETSGCCCHERTK